MLHKTVMTNRPVIRAEVLKRLPEKTATALKEGKAFNYRIYSEFESYVYSKVLSVVNPTTKPKESLAGVRGVAGVVINRHLPCTITVAPGEVTLARFRLDFSFDGFVRSTDGDVFSPLFEGLPTA